MPRISGADVLTRARAHFRPARDVSRLRKISVPEWDAEIYFFPEMSLEEAREVGRHITLQGGQAVITGASIAEAAVTQVLHRSRDQFGDRLFSDADEKALTDTDPEVLKRIAAEMGWTSSPSIEDAEKN